MNSLLYKLLPFAVITVVAVLLQSSGYGLTVIEHLAATAGPISAETLTPPPASLQYSEELWDHETPIVTTEDEAKYIELRTLHEAGTHLPTSDMVFLIQASQHKYQQAVNEERQRKWRQYRKHHRGRNSQFRRGHRRRPQSVQ